MASVDDRVVQMQFDNAAFENKIAATMASLDKLKSSLDFANSKRGLDELSTAGKNFNLQGIASAVEGISSKFSAMGVIAITVLSNIANRAFDAGVSIVKSLSLDQIIGGFQEYETNINSIQTILANTKADGTSLDQINSALQQLNTYSDDTIYNFSQMAKNIGTFTAAGVDLDSSVSAIKGIANLAAISGSNADQASTAMYQLSQALASGSVKLMDWNSIVNAGMGGEIFQKALFETGKTLKTIKDVPIDQTFEQWTKAGNTFRGSLESGWITSQVLTDTLAGFTGDLTDAQIMSMGFNEAQTKQIQEMGQTGKEAATKVKTLTQLVGTVKEAIGSGWSASFGILIGNFEEAKTLFTGISDALGKVISGSADARNLVLQGWKNMGGRDLLIQSLTDAFHGLATIMKPIKEAFREVFPPATAETLINLTLEFHHLVQKLTLTEPQAAAVKRVFEGLFNGLAIGWEVVKNVVHIFGQLFDRFTSSTSSGGGLLGFVANLGDKISALKASLVDGGGIQRFFENLGGNLTSFFDGLSFGNVVERIKGVIGDIKDAIVGLFDNVDVNLPGLDGLTDVFGRVQQRFGGLTTVAHALGDAWDFVIGKTGLVKDALSKFGDFIKDTFGNVPGAIADALSQGDYSTALDTINVGLFGGLVVLVKKFLDGGFGNGLFKNINESFTTLTGTLKALQGEIKAEALLKIAGAVAILTGAMLVLSLIDSSSLTKSLTAMAIGFAELIGTFALLDQVSSGVLDASKLTIMATGLVILSGAMLLLSVAVKILSTMGWEELAKGLGSITVLLGVLSIAVKPLSDNSAGMVTAGVGIIAISVALNILALAVKSFAEMNWTDLSRGMAGVGAGLLIIVGAVNLIPSGMVAKGAGVLAIAVAMNILALAVKSFADLNWLDMARGLAGVAASLLILAGAMHLMPNGLSMTLQGAGLALVGVGLVSIAQAIKSLSGLSWGELTKGLVGIAGSLLVLALATNAMSGTLLGAVAIGVASLSLIKLAEAVKAFSKIKWGDLLKGLAELAVSLTVLGLAGLLLAPAIIPLLGLGAALILVGAGFALFGVGANLVATAFGIIATAGSQGVATLLSALDGIITRLPALIGAIADGVIELGKKIISAMPDVISGLSEALQSLFQLIIDNAPQFGETLRVLILEGLKTLRDTFPEVVATGLAMLLALLQGIRDNIAEITTVVADIITNFLDALALKVPEIIDSVYNLIVAIITGVVAKLVGIHLLLLEKGFELIQGLMDGIISKGADVLNWFTELPGAILGWIGDVAKWLWNKGIDFIAGLIGGIIEKALDVLNWFTSLPGAILGWIGAVGKTLWNKGIDFIAGLIGGVLEKAAELTSWFTGLAVAVWGWVGDTTTALVDRGINFIWGLLDGIAQKAVDVMNWFGGLGSSVLGWIGNTGDWLLEKGKDIVRGLWEGINAMKDWIGDKIGSFVSWVTDPFSSILSIFSPSRVFMQYGVYIAQGLTMGIDGMSNKVKDSSANLAKQVVDGFQPNVDDMSTQAEKVITATFDSMMKNLGDLDSFNPTITPVLDLTNVEKEAARLSGMLTASSLGGSVSFNNAAFLAAASRAQDTSLLEAKAIVPTEIKFEQNNFSPEALSTAEIYRRTNNQIAMAKEELSVL